MAPAAEHPCQRDTVYFDDYSVVNHTGASWTWTFPGASYVSSTSVRNPKVLYPAPGNYDVTLMVSNGASSSTRTVAGMIKVTEGCSLDTIPGKAVYCSGTDKHVINSNLILPQTDSLTITAWVKPDGIQPDYSAIWMNETGDAGGFNFKNGNNSLAYHWPGLDFTKAAQDYRTLSGPASEREIRTMIRTIRKGILFGYSMPAWKDQLSQEDATLMVREILLKAEAGRLIDP